MDPNPDISALNALHDMNAMVFERTQLATSRPMDYARSRVICGSPRRSISATARTACCAGNISARQSEPSFRGVLNTRNEDRVNVRYSDEPPERRGRAEQPLSANCGGRARSNCNCSGDLDIMQAVMSAEYCRHQPYKQCSVDHEIERHEIARDETSRQFAE